MRAYSGRIVFAVIAVVVGVWIAAGSPRDTDGGLSVRRDVLVLGVDVTGTLEAVESALLGPPEIPSMWNYKIAALAPEGGKVEAGDTVVRFDTSDLERRLLEKIAERDTANGELEKQRSQLERQERDLALRLAEAEARFRKARLKVDVPEEVIEPIKLAEARIDLEEARREKEHLARQIELERRRGAAEIAAFVEKRDRAAGRVKEIEDQIRRMNVTAPRAGTVIYVTNWRDEKKKVGDQVWQQEKVAEIPDLSRMRALGEVDEADAGRVEEGQRVSLRLDAHPDLEFTGTVSRIRRTVRRQSPKNPLKVVRLEVELDTTDPLRMRPGMRFRGTIEVERLEGVLVAPAEAVFGTSEGPVAYREAAGGGWLGWLLPPQRVVLEVGKRNEHVVEIRRGLAEGDLLRAQPPEDAAR